MPGDSIGPLYWQASNYRRKMNNLEKQLFKNFRTFIVAFRLFVWRQLQEPCWNRNGTSAEHAEDAIQKFDDQVKSIESTF